MRPTLGVAVLSLLAVPSASAAPFERGMLLEGTVVTMDARDRVVRDGRVLVRGQKIVAVWSGARPPRGVKVGRAVVVKPARGLIYPGLVNLHDHPTYDMLEPWRAPSSDAQPAFGRPLGTEPYANRYQWNGGFGDASEEYRRLVSAPQDALVPSSGLGLASEAMKWAEARDLLAGETSSEGGPPDPAVDGSLARNVDEANFGRDRVDARVGPLAGDTAGAAAELARIRAGDVDAFLVHLAEGVRDGDRRPGDGFSSRDELAGLRGAGLLRSQTVIVHGTALEPADFAALRAAGAKLVWSPLSNLLLYGATARAGDALARGVLVSLGTDWAPSGSPTLLEELKVADLVLTGVPAGVGRDRTLVAMVTRNPARTLGWSREVGSVEMGKVADLVVVSRDARNPYRALVDATERDVRLTMVGGDPLAGDTGVMKLLKGDDAETVRSTRGGFAKAIDVTKAGVPEGRETLASIRAKLAAGLAGLAGGPLPLAPLLAKDDAAFFATLEGRAGTYPANVNQTAGGRNPFHGFEARWYP
jgi:5-methylthioadenosine/S-adenosylhomocysteine deaminase